MYVVKICLGVLNDYAYDNVYTNQNDTASGITYTALGVLVFFLLFPILGYFVPWGLEKRGLGVREEIRFVGVGCFDRLGWKLL